MIRTLKNTIDKTIINGDDVTIVYFALSKIVEYRKLRPNELDIYGAGDATTINWGDETITTGFSNYIDISPVTHTYDEDFVKQSTIDNPTKVIITGPLINVDKVYGPGRGFFDRSLVKIDSLTCELDSAYALFFGCEHLTTIPENIFANCPFSGANQTKCFTLTFGFTGITNVPKRLFDWAPEDSHFQSTFTCCEHLAVVDLEFGGPNSKTFSSFDRTFKDCKNLRDINPDIFKNVSPNSTFRETFGGCYSIVLTDDIFENITYGTFILTFENAFKEEDVLEDPHVSNTLGLHEKRLPDKLCQNGKNSSDPTFRTLFEPLKLVDLTDFVGPYKYTVINIAGTLRTFKTRSRT